LFKLNFIALKHTKQIMYKQFLIGIIQHILFLQ